MLTSLLAPAQSFLYLSSPPTLRKRMPNLPIDPTKFKFQYLPDYAKFILQNKLDEFVTVGIRFCRELDLPMMRPLAKLPEEQLIELSRGSNEEILTGLSANDITPFIKKNLKN